MCTYLAIQNVHIIIWGKVAKTTVKQQLNSDKWKHTFFSCSCGVCWMPVVFGRMLAWQSYSETGMKWWISQCQNYMTQRKLGRRGMGGLWRSKLDLACMYAPCHACFRTWVVAGAPSACMCVRSSPSAAWPACPTPTHSDSWFKPGPRSAVLPIGWRPSPLMPTPFIPPTNMTGLSPSRCLRWEVLRFSWRYLSGQYCLPGCAWERERDALLIASPYSIEMF